MQHIFLAGATGSIGDSTLDIIREYSDKFSLKAFTSHTNWQKAVLLIDEFRPDYAVITDRESYFKVREKADLEHTGLFFGMEEAVRLLTDESFSCVINAVVGGAGLEITYYTVLNQKRLCLANKESLVIGGELIHTLNTDCEIIPVDSEHSAIFQCLTGEAHQAIDRIWLTASGGPFWKSRIDFSLVTVSQALDHPRWSMGAKITIDSATMMNKGLEVIEAHHLFKVDYDRIFVAVHPESMVHSMVQFCDGHIIAQIGETDMKGPILYSLTYPERIKNRFSKFDLFETNRYNFHRPDLKRFRCLRLAYNAGKQGTEKCILLNAANEVAVDLFLKNRITFADIPGIIEEMLSKDITLTALDIESIRHMHDEAFRKTEEYYEKKF
ncbi:MAG: 1-deoxy-D-xylulose-5-phosphate reductoisomerase [Candidatus Muiribacteriaceae bacterium]